MSSIKSVLSKLLRSSSEVCANGVDESSLEYLSGLLKNAIESGARSEEAVAEALRDGLINYGLVDDEDAADKFGAALFKKLKAKDLLAEEEEEEEEEDEEEAETEVKTAEAAAKPTKKGKSSKKSEFATDKTAERMRRMKIEEKLESEEVSLDTILGARGTIPTGESRDLHMQGVYITMRGHELLSNVSLKLFSGHRYGLIGRNGTGKTTLLRRIANRQIVGFPPYLSVVHVQQEVVGNDLTAVDFVLRADSERSRLLGEEDSLLHELERLQHSPAPASAAPHETQDPATPTPAAPTAAEPITDVEATGVESSAEVQTDEHVAKVKSIAARLAEVGNRLRVIDAYSAEARVAEILDGLGFTDQMKRAPTSTLSGGWRMRVALAVVLFLQPDILMLDEPTNHLDLSSVIWLQDYLKEYPFTLVVVSHDRDFLNAVATDIIHLHRKQLTYYTGNYDGFMQTREEHLTRMKNTQESIDRQRAHFQETIRKMETSAKKGGDQKKLGQVASRRKKLERMGMEKTMDGKKFKWQQHGFRQGSMKEGGGGWDNRKLTARSLVESADPEIQFQFPDPIKLNVTGPVLQLKEVSFAYPSPSDPAAPSESKEPSQRTILQRVTLNFGPTEKIAILGRNGSGKSTLLGLIAGQLQENQGEIYRHHNLCIAYFTQHHVTQLDHSLSALEHMHQRFPDRKEHELRAHLGRFGLQGNTPLRPISTLSGGQKSRVVFAALTLMRPQFLMLDEPTNHLDVDSIEALIEALQAFNGGVIVVSHDQNLIRRVCSVFVLVDKGRAVPLETSFDEYVEQMSEY